jgi:signal transduction histidine kinase
VQSKWLGISMIEKLRFETDATIITRLGKELVAKQETALIELIKNAFDADATRVDVILTDDFLSHELHLSDDGLGMTREELIDGFLRIASPFKKRLPHSRKFKRTLAGSKGIGRFAAQRLGERLTLETRAAGMQNGLRLMVDWNEFVSGRDLSVVEVTLDEVAECKFGTTLKIAGLRDSWSDVQVRRCWRAVLSLQQPFPVAPVEGRSDADPGFTVKFVRRDDLLGGESTVADLNTEILNHLHAIVELHVDHEGRARWKLSKNRFGEVRDWQHIHHGHSDLKDPPTYESLRNVWMKAHYVILQPDLLPSLVFTRVRDVLAEFGGVRLYRNGFRVVPYGDPGNDWLRLDEMYAKRSVLAPIANRNFYGVVEIQDTGGVAFEEHTSREGLIETQAFVELKELASSVLITAATRISEDRGRKARAGGRKDPSDSKLLPDSLAAIGEAVKAVQQAAEQAAESGSEISAKLAEQARAVVQLVHQKSSDIARKEQDLADEAAMLRFLATLGMTSAEFNHETGMTFDAFRLDFDRIFEASRPLWPSDSEFVERADRAKGMLNRLDSLTSYLNTLASARALRGRQPTSMTRAIKEFSAGMTLQAQSQGISLSIDLPEYEALFTGPMHRAEVASILLNLYTNAVKAVKRRGADRLIKIHAKKAVGTDSVRICFCDSGDGIPTQNREKVFDPFFTTSTAPPASAPDTQHATGTGLGLWIVHQIVDNAGGSIMVADGELPYVTCIEIELPSEAEDGN